MISVSSQFFLWILPITNSLTINQIIVFRIQNPAFVSQGLIGTV